MIKIFKNGVEIEIVKDTLTINRDNNFLDNDFKIQANSFPFLILENNNTHNVLGSKAITSINRDTYHSVTVQTPEGVFDGELQILSYLKNYRKCNLRFFSPIYNLRDVKIGTFLPEHISVVSGVIQPLYDYEEKRSTLIPKNFIEDWKTFGVNILNKGFPETLFNLPNYSFPNKFGEGLTEEDDWYPYNGAINSIYYDAGVKYMHVNTYDTFGGETIYNNKTVNSPQVYLLAPLKLAVESVGYTAQGNFFNNDFVKRLLFYSEKNNLCEIVLKKQIKTIAYTNGGWVNLFFGQSIKHILFDVPVGKRYKIEIVLKRTWLMPIKAQLTLNGVAGSSTVQIFNDPPLNQTQTLSADFVPPYTGASTANIVLSFIKGSWVNSIEPIEVTSITIYEIASKTGYVSHPIINLQRYVPDWSFIEYINELKKLFNLKITPNDHDKTISFDFFNDKFVQKNGVVLKEAYLNNFESQEFDSLLLKYDNDEDDNVFVTKNTISVSKNKAKEHTQEVSSKFKYMPVLTSGLILNEDIEDKSGVGLVLYNHSNITNSTPVESYNGYSLSLENIFKNNYELSFKNYLTSGVFTTKTYLSNKQLKDIVTNDFVFIDNKRYYVNTMSYKETPNGLYETNFELLLMMY